MSLLQTLKDDQLQARKDKDTTKATILTTLIGDAAIIGKNNGNRESTDEEVSAVIKKFVKNINETLKVVDLMSLKLEKEILEGYLPQQLSEDALRSIVTDVIKELDVTSPKAMGNVMKVLKERYGGTYDGKMASNIVREQLK